MTIKTSIALLTLYGVSSQAYQLTPMNSIYTRQQNPLPSRSHQTRGATVAFSRRGSLHASHPESSLSSSSITDTSETASLDPTVCSKFSIRVCASTACAKKRKMFDMDEFATFGAMWERRSDADATEVQIEESTCLGACQRAPCVAVQHEEYEGNVGLEGMTEEEFGASLFHSVVTEEDCDRVWGCVENAIKVCMEDEDEDEYE